MASNWFFDVSLFQCARINIDIVRQVPVANGIVIVMLKFVSFIDFHRFGVIDIDTDCCMIVSQSYIKMRTNKMLNSLLRYGHKKAASCSKNYHQDCLCVTKTNDLFKIAWQHLVNRMRLSRVIWINIHCERHKAAVILIYIKNPKHMTAQNANKNKYKKIFVVVVVVLSHLALSASNVESLNLSCMRKLREEKHTHCTRLSCIYKCHNMWNNT